MSARPTAAMAVRFLDCELDPAARLLVRRGAPTHLTPKALDLLLLLVAERPRAVPKAELLDRVWPGTFVTDASLARTVHEIREAIGDTDAIRTIHGHGYAFGLVATDVELSTPPAAHAAPSAASAWLIIDGRALPLLAGTSLIGRDPAVAVPLASAQVSWHHAAIDAAAGACTLTDLGSKNGTMVNGARVTVPAVLGDGDVISIGGTYFVFRTAHQVTETKTTAPA